MKKQITEKQIKELSPEASKKLIAWALKHSPQNWICRCLCKPPLMNIGDMIEFLDTQSGYRISITDLHRSKTWMWEVYCYPNRFVKRQLCDALWEVVKEVLEK